MYSKTYVLLSIAMLFVFFGNCDNSNDESESDAGGTAPTTTLTAQDVIGTWTGLQPTLPGVTLANELVFTASAFTFAQDMYTQTGSDADTTHPWQSEGTWSIVDGDIVLNHTACMHFDTPWPNCNDLDETALFSDGKIQYESCEMAE